MGLEFNSSAKSFFNFTGVLSTVIAASSLITISAVNPAVLLGTGISLGAVTGLSIAGAILSFAGAAMADVFQKRANQDELVSKLTKSPNIPQMSVMQGYVPLQPQQYQQYQQQTQYSRQHDNEPSWTKKIEEERSQPANLTNMAAQR